MIVHILSFGFKHGPPTEADLLLDVRFLPNPYYLTDLKETTGLEPATAAYVLENTKGRDFFNRLIPLLQFLLKEYQGSKRDAMTICIGCTGGRHRSVAVAEKLALLLGHQTTKFDVSHRDIFQK